MELAAFAVADAFIWTVIIKPRVVILTNERLFVCRRRWSGSRIGRIVAERSRVLVSVEQPEADRLSIRSNGYATLRLRFRASVWNPSDVVVNWARTSKPKPNPAR